MRYSLYEYLVNWSLRNHNKTVYREMDVLWKVTAGEVRLKCIKPEEGTRCRCLDFDLFLPSPPSENLRLYLKGKRGDLTRFEPRDAIH